MISYEWVASGTRTTTNTDTESFRSLYPWEIMWENEADLYSLEDGEPIE